MASAEQLLRTGVDQWNDWRDEHPSQPLDLKGVCLPRANLLRANLQDANLTFAELQGADLRYGNLQNAKLRGTELQGANLKEADLRHANLRHANLQNARLEKADLVGADLQSAKLNGARMRDAQAGKTVFGNVDLSAIEGLDRLVHSEPSIVDGGTLALGKGELPEAFLRGCGLTDWEIAAARLHAPDLTSEQITDIAYEIDRLRGVSPIQVNPLFLSYAHEDAEFLDALEKYLNKTGTRFWRDVHDLKAGPVEHQIETAIRHNPTVVLVLSERSVDRDWVRAEAEMARELERELGRNVLCPVRLDDAWERCSWPRALRQQIEDYHILDFSQWRKGQVFAKQFARLIDGLGIYYTGES